MFRIASQRPEVEFRCSSRSSAQPFEAAYSSYNISQRKQEDQPERTFQPAPEGTGTWDILNKHTEKN